MGIGYFKIKKMLQKKFKRNRTYAKEVEHNVVTMALV